MSADAWKSLPTNTCHSCHADAPAGTFCGICGTALVRRRGDGTTWLRLRTYAAAPKEHVLSLTLAGALFPRLPRRSRTAFALGLIALAVLLVAFAVLRWQGPLIAISALGLPLLFLIYLNESDTFTDLPARTLALTAVVAVGLGVGWALFAGGLIARTYDDALGMPLTVGEKLVSVVAIPAGEVFLMFGPVVLARLLRPRDSEALDGFAIGALAALCFTSAGTFTRLAPQFETGLVGSERPITDFLITATIQGVAIPLTAAAVTGMVGTALWFRPRADPDRRWLWYVFTTPAPAVFVGLVAYIGIGWLDVSQIPDGIAACLYTLIALGAVLALRFVLHSTLLHEVADDTAPDTAVLCPQCDHVVPDLAFCPNCGVAARAASRSSRHARRANRPVPATAAPEGR
ncbi:hypothetical protein BH09ACT7_BH09ACT7_10720 [soil metagenome]